MDAHAIFESLAQVAERCGDPAPLVYERLFARWPEMAEQFVRDTDGAIRGEMLAIVLQTILALAEGEASAPHMITAELVNHDAWGVRPAVFGAFFVTVSETFREILGDDWTPPIDSAWRDLLIQLDDLVADQARASGLPLD